MSGRAERRQAQYAAVRRWIEAGNVGSVRDMRAALGLTREQVETALARLRDEGIAAVVDTRPTDCGRGAPRTALHGLLRADMRPLAPPPSAGPRRARVPPVLRLSAVLHTRPPLEAAWMGART